MSDSGFLVQQIAELRKEIRELRNQRTTYVQGEVTATDSGASTFTAEVSGLVDGSTATLAGIKASASFLPTIGDSVLLALSGAQPVFQPGRVAGGAIGTVELADDAITLPKLASDVTLSINGKTSVTFSTSPATGGVPGTTDGDIWWQYRESDDMIVGSWQWNGSSWVLRAFDDEILGSLTAAKILTGTLAAGVVVSVGDTEGEHSTLEDDGIHAYAVDPDDGLPTEIAYFGRGLGVRDPATGLVVATLGEDGSITGTDLNVGSEDPVFGGMPLSELLWYRSWGIVGYAEVPDVNAASTATSTEQEFLELAFTLVPGRAYALRSEPVQYDCDTAQGARIKIRRTTDGTTPELTSAQFREIAYAPETSGWVDRHPLNIYLGGIDRDAEAETWRLLLTYGTGNGSTNVTVWMGEVGYFWIEDIGPLADNIGVLRVGAGGGGGEPAAKVTTTVEFGATWTRSWKQSGAVSFDDPMYQGYGDSFNGAQSSACGFPSVTTLLSGATINNIWVYMYAEHWWNISGGTLRLGYHSSLSEPASFPGHTNNNAVAFTARGQGKWIDVTSWNGGAWKTALQSGAFRGISAAPPSTSAIYYGRFSGASKSRPRIRIRYTK